MAHILNPVIKSEASLVIVGLSCAMSLAENKTMQLWQAFAPRRKKIERKLNGGSYSLQVYGKDFGTKPFLPTTIFTKWAGVAVKDDKDIPTGLEVLKIPEGRWAVFTYKGTTSNFGAFAQNIYGTWLPQSGYTLDNRPHFEYMSEDYAGPNNPSSEEEVWIPIK